MFRSFPPQILLWPCMAVAALLLALDVASIAAAQNVDATEKVDAAPQAVSAPHQEAEENLQEEVFVVIRAGRVLTLAGPELENVDIVVVDGLVRLVGKDLSYPHNARVIDARHEVVMPGLIHPHSRWQLPGYAREGVHADRSAAKEVFLDELDFEPFLAAGFTSVCFYPDGTGVPGQGTVYRVAGPEDRRALGPGYLRIVMTSPGRDKRVLRDALSKARQEIDKVEKARKQWDEEQAKAKQEAKKDSPAGGDGQKPPAEKQETPTDKTDTPSAGEKKSDAAATADKPKEFVPPPIDPSVLALVEWIRDKKGTPILYELNSAADLLHLDDVLQQAKELPRGALLLTSSYYGDWSRVAQTLGQRRATVIVSPGIGTLPDTDIRYHLPAELALAGCKIALTPRSDSPSALDEHRLLVADLVRAGLPRDEALKAMTLRPAELLQIQQRVGSIEKGKDADLVFLDGDPLAPQTKVKRVMTLGQIVWESKQ